MLSVAANPAANQRGQAGERGVNQCRLHVGQLFCFINQRQQPDDGAANHPNDEVFQDFGHAEIDVHSDCHRDCGKANADHAIAEYIHRIPFFHRSQLLFYIRAKGFEILAGNRQARLAVLQGDDIISGKF